jgi:hypothetical protein
MKRANLAFSLSPMEVVAFGSFGQQKLGPPPVDEPGVYFQDWAMPHISDDALELCLMGRLTETEVAPLDEHLLICEECRNRVQETETYIAAMRALLERRETEGVAIHIFVSQLVH